MTRDVIARKLEGLRCYPSPISFVRRTRKNICKTLFTSQNDVKQIASTCVMWCVSDVEQAATSIIALCVKLRKVLVKWHLFDCSLFYHWTYSICTMENKSHKCPIIDALRSFYEFTRHVALPFVEFAHAWKFLFRIRFDFFSWNRTLSSHAIVSRWIEKRRHNCSDKVSGWAAMHLCGNSIFIVALKFVDS